MEPNDGSMCRLAAALHRSTLLQTIVATNAIAGALAGVAILRWLPSMRKAARLVAADLKVSDF